MGEALGLVIGGSPLLYAIAFSVLCVVLQVWITYERYARYLKWLCLVLFSYVATVFMVHVPWGTALK
jgi:Mn2+/Fe2+ NRAMP family transporter